MARWSVILFAVVSVVLASLVSCGPPQVPLEQVCSDAGCDGCIGATCGRP